MNRNMVIHIVVVYFLFSCGCASISNPVTGEAVSRARVVTEDTQKWEWGKWMLHINERHDGIDVEPVRESSCHLNVLKFVEDSPCSDCLMIGKPIPQGDGTVKVKVILSHPFPGSPRYTGFDVRGTVIFPATRYWTAPFAFFSAKDLNNPWLFYPPFNFSWHGDGGGSLLNGDGYSFYFWPGFDLGEGYELPVYHYQPGKHAFGTEPDSTINPYITFNDDSPRRMFKTTDVIQRTYHLRVPEGEFSFGYVVEASWAPPLTVPVTNPEQDFPPYANTEDPIILSFEQLHPLDPYHNETVNPAVPFAECTFIRNSCMESDFGGGGSGIIAPDIRYWKDTPEIWLSVAYGGGGIEIGEDLYKSDLRESLSVVDDPPYVDGSYLALLYVFSIWDFNNPCMEYATIAMPTSFKIIEIELQSSGN